MSYLSVRVAHITKAFAAFVVLARHDEFATCSTVSFALSYCFLISISLVMIGEKSLAPKMFVAVRTGDSNPCRYTRRTRHAVTTCLVASVCDIARTALAARFTHIPFVHGCDEFHYHVIISGNLFVQQVQSIG